MRMYVEELGVSAMVPSSLIQDVSQVMMILSEMLLSPVSSFSEVIPPSHPGYTGVLART